MAAGRRVFRDYLRLEYSEENMLFWLAVEELRSEHDERRVMEQVRLIYEDFISILSPREVSLDAPASHQPLLLTFTYCQIPLRVRYPARRQVRSWSQTCSELDFGLSSSELAASRFIFVLCITVCCRHA